MQLQQQISYNHISNSKEYNKVKKYLNIYFTLFKHSFHDDCGSFSRKPPLNSLHDVIQMLHELNKLEIITI